MSCLTTCFFPRGRTRVVDQPGGSDVHDPPVNGFAADDDPLKNDDIRHQPVFRGRINVSTPIMNGNVKNKTAC